jgi:hypothetical protein
MTKKRIAGVVIGVLALVAIVGISAGVMLLSQYVTIESVNQKTAARAFDSAREQMNGQTPLIEYRDQPVVHRDSSATRHALGTINVLAYDADEGELKRVTIPAHVVELATLGGRIRLMNLDAFGDDRDRITLADLERHGPGLVLDLNATSVPEVGVANFILRRKALSARTRLMVWTE